MTYIKPSIEVIQINYEPLLTKHSGRGKSNEHTNDPHNYDEEYNGKHSFDIWEE